MSPLSKEQFDEIREESRGKIIMAALKLFSSKGFESTTISEIAKEAKISKGLVYNYFTSKDELLEETLVFILKNIEERLKEVSKIENPYSRLEITIRSNFEMIKMNPELWKMFVVLTLQLDKESKASKILNTYWTKLFENAFTIFKEMGHENYKELAIQYGALMDGLAMQHVVLNGTSSYLDKALEKVIKQYCTQ